MAGLSIKPMLAESCWSLLCPLHSSSSKKSKLASMLAAAAGQNGKSGCSLQTLLRMPNQQHVCAFAKIAESNGVLRPVPSIL